MLTINESAKYLGIFLSPMYKLTHRRELPIYKPSGGKVYKKLDDLITYMTKNRLMSQDEIDKEAINYVVKNPLKKFR
jgi:excisionase family DNA binding protein